MKMEDTRSTKAESLGVDPACTVTTKVERDRVLHILIIQLVAVMNFFFIHLLNQSRCTCIIVWYLAFAEEAKRMIQSALLH